MKSYKTTLTIVFVQAFLFSASCFAQKQPQIQEASVLAPINVTIDGKLNEWPNPFLRKNNEAYLSAYNSGSRLYYTISNDDKNVYFTLRGLGTLVASKILKGGIVITVGSQNSKYLNNSKKNISIMFPVPTDEKTASQILGPIFSLNNYIKSDTTLNKKEIDSLVSIASTRLGISLKEVKISGIDDIADSVESIYNEYGIKAAGGFIKRMPVIELAIPLKYLAKINDGSNSFSYNIKLPGVRIVYVSGANDIDKQVIQAAFSEDTNYLYSISPTDFSGKFTLMKDK